MVVFGLVMVFKDSSYEDMKKCPNTG